MSKKKTKKPRKSNKPTSKHIRDNPTFKQVSDSITNIRTIREVMPILEPLLNMSGIDVSGVNNGLHKVDDVEKKFEELKGLPDRFNNFFVDHGWIAYDNLNKEIALEAVEKAEAGDYAGAEQHLVEHFNAETVSTQLSFLCGLNSFKPRIRLANKALEDYKEERYHACVPVVLALADGLVNELNPDNRGMFAGTTELDAWDSIAAHSSGFGRLLIILRKGRYKTTTDQITLPYRNGIMHGTDLGYDNKIVAAKTWAMLLAVGEWAKKVERGEIEAPKEKPKETWTDTIKKIQEGEQFRKAANEWKPREPISLDIDTFEENSAEFALKEYLTFWSQKNYGRMTVLLPYNTFATNAAPGRIRKHFENRILKSFKFESIKDVGFASTKINVWLEIEEYGTSRSSIQEFVMYPQDAQGNIVGRNQDDLRWVSKFWDVY
ncbi:hypothetical protein [Paenibacillus gallinarum]|uniref:Uncharacterized protein n=1 Tax=Paenibacillus gallinarum TaxID=2762232 RepID=A0ABR8T5R4_9BACL|nr:hypothetical protein [Paenibacillus gallinarum]MBD7971107.1 hypothetical protein [Paenibacillus gallinarum]